MAVAESSRFDLDALTTLDRLAEGLGKTIGL
jgi:hypothetical protein